jgi:hypothetical protein
MKREARNQKRKIRYLIYRCGRCNGTQYSSLDAAKTELDYLVNLYGLPQEEFQIEKRITCFVKI